MTEQTTTLSSEIKELIKYQLLANTTRYFFYITFIGILIGVYLLATINEGNFEIVAWAKITTFLALTVVLGLSAWKWSTTRMDKNKSLKQLKTFGGLTTEKVQESVRVDHMKTINFVSMVRVFLLILGLLYTFLAVFGMHSITIGMVEEENLGNSIQYVILGGFNILASLIVSVFYARTAKKVWVKIEEPEEEESTSGSTAETD